MAVDGSSGRRFAAGRAFTHVALHLAHLVNRAIASGRMKIIVGNAAQTTDVLVAQLQILIGIDQTLQKNGDIRAVRVVVGIQRRGRRGCSGWSRNRRGASIGVRFGILVLVLILVL